MRRRFILAATVLLVCPVLAQERKTASDETLRECGDPNIIFGATPSAWLSAQFGTLGALATGLPPTKALGYRAGLERVLKDADAAQSALKELPLREQIGVDEVGAAAALIGWNHVLDQRYGLALACIANAYIPDELFAQCTEELRAVRTARTKLPCVNDLEAKLEHLEGLPPAAWRNYAGWELAAKDPHSFELDTVDDTLSNK